MSRLLEIFFIFLKLGLIAFGGPIAHISFFHREFVINRKWLSEQIFSELVSLCQFLPGPASSQLGMSIGAYRNGLSGSIAAFVGFTLPSAVLMILFAFGLNHYTQLLPNGFLHGMQLAAIAVVMQAVWQMGKTSCFDKERALLMITSATVVSLVPGIFGQLLVLTQGAVVGYLFLKEEQKLVEGFEFPKLSNRMAVVMLSLFFGLLLILPALNEIVPSEGLTIFDKFYRTGSLVFGGGHVVLSLLEEEVVKTGLISQEKFISAYGFAQAIPGPLFSISAFIGAESANGTGGLCGAILALFAIFLPAFLILFGVLPFWESCRNKNDMNKIMKGVNASVVGLLVAVLYQPLFTTSIRNEKDFYLLAVGFVFLQFWRIPSIVIVFFMSISSVLLS